MDHLSSFAGAQGQRVRLLRIYLGATTFLYLYGVVFTLFPIRTDIAYGNPIGGIIAIVLGLAGLLQLAVAPGRLLPATVAACVATPIVMAFHVTLTAEYMCLIAPMFLAMYVRAFHPPRQAWCIVVTLAAACCVAVAVAPAPFTGVITFLIIVVAIIGAAESFGLLMRAMFSAACTDPMTGLLNRAGWEIGTSDLLSRARATRTPVTVVAIDIVGLKRLNDTYGHRAGDRRIIDYARSWRQAAPRNAVVARLGGDEFAIGVAAADPGVVADFLRAIARRTPEASVGTATQDAAEANISELYAHADSMLYQSRGRPLSREDPEDVDV
ncbi:GGDEF domain-containing protein [Mycobacterium sp. MS1601]|uniref:GGDEF domain-containing protein n=1 Tax=Mycobacterium sp. MS1601 TaxID=1936029 RepID=UPI0009795BD3|nr:GGDEF domain-containing protein [Mycobacterium sp. MS1601]AQA04875.1 GGDEF domain-containing protein [Mycobacterium sp. MS1601]